MKDFLQIERQELEDLFEAKLMELRGPDQEESKELGLLAKHIQKLEECLQMTSQRIIQTVRESASKAINPLNAYASKIESIHSQFEQFKTHWKGKEESNLQDKIEGLQMLKAIKELILKLKPSSSTPAPIIQFDSDAIFKAISSTIQIRDSSISQYEPENLNLLTLRGYYDLESGAFMEKEVQHQIPQNYACFQNNSLLYICGGSAKIAGKKQYLTDLWSVNVSMKVVPLASMKHPRQNLSLCGNIGSLLSVGGWKGETLQAVEQFSISLNKWQTKAPLKIARICPGTCYLQNKTAFCFCGFRDGNIINSIEQIDLSKDQKWKFLPFNGQVAKNYHLAVAKIEDKLVVFGGVERSLFSLQYFSTDGKLQEEGTPSPQIPGYMCSRAFIVKKGCIYTEGRNEEGERGLKVYEGFQWVVR